MRSRSPRDLPLSLIPAPALRATQPALRVSLRCIVLAAIAATALVATSVAAAHGTLSPAVTAAGVSQRFELTVPNARLDADIVAISLEMPDRVVLESAEASQPRWAVRSDESSVRWTGGPIDRGSAETFAFTARLAAEAGPAQFTLVESYDDGDAAPFPITVVASGPTGGSDDSDGSLAAVALVLAMLALLVAAGALAVALRARR
jgi:uncharacterized protein YcnI